MWECLVSSLYLLFLVSLFTCGYFMFLCDCILTPPASPETPARMMSYYANARLQPIHYGGPLFAHISSVPAQPHNRAYKGPDNRVVAAALPPANTYEKGQSRLAPGYANARLQNLGYATYQSLNVPRRPTRPVTSQYMEYSVAQGFPNAPVIGPRIPSQMNARYVVP